MGTNAFLQLNFYIECHLDLQKQQHKHQEVQGLVVAISKSFPAQEKF